MEALETFHRERKRFLKSMKLVGVYSLIGNVCMLAMPVFMINTYRVVLPTENTSSLLGLYIFAMVILAAMGVFEGARQVLLSRAASRLEVEMAGLIMAGELNRQHDPRPLTLQELVQIKNLISGNALSSVFDLPMVPLFTAIVFLIHPVLGFTLVVGAAVMVWLAIWTNRDVADLTMKVQEESTKSSLAAQQMFSMQEYIRSQGLYREALNDWGRNQARVIQSGIDLANQSAVHQGMSKSSRLMFQVTLIGVGALLVLSGEAQIIVVFAASMIGGRALAPLDGVINNWRVLRQGLDTYRSLEERLKEISFPDQRTPLPPPSGRLDVHRLTYVPKPGAAPILRAVHFGVEAGTSIAIIGPNGAGKSTLARCLVGYLEPSVGAVKLDGQALNVWDPIALGYHIGYVPQQVDFFEASVRENIASMRRDEPAEWAVEAAQKAGVHEMIMRLPEGYDTQLTRRGFWPSGGQAQLIALARAFYGDPKVLVLDEPNAALDQQGEQILHKSLLQARADKITVVVVTQRPALLRIMDQVLILQGGTVKAVGPRDEVMANQGVRAVEGASVAPAQAKAEPSPPADDTDKKSEAGS